MTYLSCDLQKLSRNSPDLVVFHVFRKIDPLYWSLYSPHSRPNLYQFFFVSLSIFTNVQEERKRKENNKNKKQNSKFTKEANMMKRIISKPKHIWNISEGQTGSKVVPEALIRRVPWWRIIKKMELTPWRCYLILYLK